MARAALVNLVAGGTEQGASTITMQLAREFFLSSERTYTRKIVEVLTVENLNHGGKFVERWLSLVKVRATMETRPHVLQIADVFRCRVVDMGSDALTLEVTGDEGKVEACTEALRAYGIIEIAGSGSVALSRAGFQTNGEINDMPRVSGLYAEAQAGSSPICMGQC